MSTRYIYRYMLDNRAHSTFRYHRSFKELVADILSFMYLSYEKDRPQIFVQNDTNLRSISCFIQELESFS